MKFSFQQFTFAGVHLENNNKKSPGLVLLLVNGMRPVAVMCNGNRSFTGRFDFCQGKKSDGVRCLWAMLPFTTIILHDAGQALFTEHCF